MKNLLWISVLAWAVVACNGSGSQANENVDDVEVADPNAAEQAQMDLRTSNRQRQYFIQGKKLYTMHCSSCHQTDGSGLAALYPPLKGSNLLAGNEAWVACGIKHGMKGPMEVNGVTFNQQMAALGHLTNLEIAEIMTYVYTDFGPEERAFIDVKTVDDYLKACSGEMVTAPE